MKAYGAGLVVMLALLLSGTVSAQPAQYGEANAAGGPMPDVAILEEGARSQAAQLEQHIEEAAAVGHEIEEAQAGVEGAGVRMRQLDQRLGTLEGEIGQQRRNLAKSEARYKEQVRAAYRGDSVEGFVGFLESIVGAGRGGSALTPAQMHRALLSGRKSLEDFRGARQDLRNTVRQVEQKRGDYEKAVRDEKKRTAELRRREQRLERTVSRLSSNKARTDTRIQRLRKAERERIQRSRPATFSGSGWNPGSGGPVLRARELKIARDEIVARPAKPISKKQYKKLYQRSAKKYGFGKDWYILAAVGKVESDHGENMGPSSAGAMGPMQFLPSTWETAGVDGNGDGVANVMDPRDAIPAAARYLKAGGAPKNWYAALYSYNHADWYVKKVLGVAEGYRRLAKDDRVGPYA